MRELDCLGEMCPLPVMRIKESLKTMYSGETIKVVTDHSCVHQSILVQFKKSKVEIDYEEVINGVWEIFITKT